MIYSLSYLVTNVSPLQFDTFYNQRYPAGSFPYLKLLTGDLDLDFCGHVLHAQHRLDKNY